MNWMIRKRNGQVLGPFAGDDLGKRLKSGELDSSDEICPSAGHWFSIQESAEIRRYFGELLIPRQLSPGTSDLTMITDTESHSRDVGSRSNALLKLVVLLAFIAAGFLLLLITSWLRAY